ncbi:glycosyltransferase family 4 protein [Cellulosilyticum ruminicola]|uniref:glycosyltransferase family 4 protein n=1 Tax=Cellulosilyticum ruminicola TaxID=425254 RepID=UPI0009FA6327|nr:glycosyltransferase family 4 protein [Cellulosilyticum ruminicola]
MNIGIFTDTYSPQVNGVVSSILTLENVLRKQGHQIYVFTISHPDAENDSPYIHRMASLPFVFLKDHRVGIIFSNKALRKIKRLKLDLILSQTEFSLGIFAKLVSKRLNIPIVHTYHTMYEEYMHYVSKGIELSPAIARKYSRSFCNGVDGVVAPTRKTERLLKNYGVKKPIRVIPTGIDFSPFNPSGYTTEEITTIKKVHHIPLDSPIVLFIGRVAKEKSIDMVIDAMPKLLEKVPKAKLVIVGDGPSKLELEEQAQNLGVRDAVIFTGIHPWRTIGKMYQLGDIFVSASVSETQGLTFAEAMAAKLPVLAREDECVAGLIRDHYNGAFFNNSTQLAALLAEFLSNPDQLYTMGENAVHSIRPLSAEVFGINAEAFYNEIVTDYKAQKRNKSFALPHLKTNKDKKRHSSNR